MTRHRIPTRRSTAAFVGGLLVGSLAWVYPANADIPWTTLVRTDGVTLSNSQKAAVRAALTTTHGLFDCDKALQECLAKPRAKATMSWRLAEYAAFLGSRGLTEKEIRRVLELRRRGLTGSVHQIAVAGYPRLGPERAPIQIVEYADFRCGHCAKVSPLLTKLALEYKGKVSIVFKPYPLQPYGASLLAAQAAMAAFRQGKFWQMSELLFKHRDKHTPKGLAELARKVGLSDESFSSMMKDRGLLKLVEKSKISGMRLGVRSTPTIFFNGRAHRLRKDQKHLRERIEDELYRLKHRS